MALGAGAGGSRGQGRAGGAKGSGLTLKVSPSSIVISTVRPSTVLSVFDCGGKGAGREGRGGEGERRVSDCRPLDGTPRLGAENTRVGASLPNDFRSRRVRRALNSPSCC